MSEWGGYFRRAVANVEQRLDQALQESQEVRLPARESSQEPSSQSQAMDPGSDQVSVQVCTDFVDPPDLSSCVLAARNFALNLDDSIQNTVKDKALDLVESMEKASAETDKYISSTTDRLVSLHSKIEKLSSAKGDFGDDKDKQIAQLFDEGQRLSQRELKLGQQVKRLRADLSKATDKAIELSKPELEARDRKILDLDAEISRIRGRNVELETALDHIRLSGQEFNNSEVSSGLTELERRLEAAQASHAAAQASWREVELGLLNRIASLENDNEQWHSMKQSFQQRIYDAQAQARDARNLTIELQDKIDDERRKREDAEDGLSTLRRKLSEKEEKEEHQSKDAFNGHVNGDFNGEAVDTAIQASGLGLDGDQRDEPQPKVLENGHDGDISHDKPAVQVESPVQKFEEPILDRFIDLGPTEPPVMARDTSSHLDDRDDQIPSLLEMPTPSRTDFGHGDSFESNADGQGTSMHMVRRLTSAVRRLESELSATKRNLELASNQREQTQREMVGLVDAQDELLRLREEYAAQNDSLKDTQEQLKSSQDRAAGRAERISELQADVQDLKDMYREQVETLVAQIEELKKSA